MKAKLLMASLAGVMVAAAAAVCLTGCANLGYYWQSASGHIRLLNAAKPVDEWLADGTASPQLKERLALSQRIRAFASAELRLPDNPSYRRYADLKRNAVIWNVVAAPEYSLTLKTWCFPVTGCVGYRGYFDEAAARAQAEAVKAEGGLEVAVYPVPAYSTLGWMNWAGGDPLLNTFIHYPEGELARLIFHELAHQVVYAKDDTMFNESFASAVERLGSRRWLATQASEQARQEYVAFDARRTQFRQLTLDMRRKLALIYEQKEAPAPTGSRLAAMKKRAYEEFRADYAKLRDSWGGDPARYRGFDLWVERANNATLGAQAAYDELVPGFEALFEREGRDFQRFYDAVKRLAALPREERRAQLRSKETTGA